MDDPAQVKVPLRLNDILSGTYYSIAITATLLGLVVWALNQSNRINQSQADIKFALQRIDDLDIHGTRALSDRVGILEQARLVTEQRLNDVRKTADILQAEVSRIDNQLTQIKERQDVNTKAVRDLLDKIYERGPTAPRSVK